MAEVYSDHAGPCISLHVAIEMAALVEYEVLIREKIETCQWTHKQVTSFLKQMQRGLSVRSVERFCSTNNIHKTSRIDDQSLDQIVSTATNMVRSADYLAMSDNIIMFHLK